MSFKNLKLLLIFCLLFFKVKAQCPPVFDTVSATVCQGDTLFGYYTGGIYNDTFDIGNGCDSIRVLLLTVAPLIAQSPAVSYFNTGTNDLGGVLSNGSNDYRWMVATTLNGTYAPAVVIGNNPSYAPSIWPDCTWISHNSTATHVGDMDFFYKISFMLPCKDSCNVSFDSDSSFCFGLQFMADNAVEEIYVNGVPQSANINGIPVINPYWNFGFSAGNIISATFCNNWHSGLNTMIVHIKSGSPLAAFLAQASPVLPPAPQMQSAFSNHVNGVFKDTVCAGDILNFVNQSVNAGGYIWNFGDGTSLNYSSNPTHIFQNPGTYIVSLIASNTCIGSDTFQKPITVLPKHFDTINAKICEGTAYSAFNNTYTQPGTYTHTFQGVSGCDSTIIINLSFYPEPEIDYTDIRVFTACKNKNNGMAYVVRDTADNNTYSWINQNNIIVSATDTLQQVVAGIYTLKISNVFNCIRTMQVEIAEEEVSFICDTLICSIDTILFQNSSTTPLFTWSFGDGNESNQQHPVHQYLNAGVYSVRLIGFGNGCVDTAVKLIHVDTPAPDILFLVQPKEICTGQKIRLHLSTDGSETRFDWHFSDYFWSTTDINNYYEQAFENPGTFPVTLTATYRACPERSFTDTVHVYPLPLVDLGADSVLCLHGSPIILYNHQPHYDGYRYLWSDGDTNRTYTALHHGIYTLMVTNQYGCANTESINIEKDCYIDIPNAFTPNGDGENDYFFPRQLLSKSLKRFKMQIFNRWGQVIFETTRIDGRGWDGTFNSKAQPLGVYIYLIEAEFENGRAERYKGNVTLIR